MENKGEIWQDFIRRRIAPAQLTTLSPDVSAISSLMETAAQARDEFIGWLMEEVTTLKNEEQLKILVFGYQTQLCFLSDLVLGYREQMADHPKIVRLYDTVLSEFEQSLNSLQHYFPRYFDQQAPAPKSLLHAFQHAVGERQSQITQISEKADPVLAQLIFSVLNSFPGVPLCLGQVAYLRSILEEFLSAVTSTLSVPYGTRLMQWCIVRNFNAPTVLELMVNRLSDLFQALETENEKREWLTSYGKYLSQLPAHGEGGLFENRLSLKDHLFNWAEKERNALPAGQRKETELPGASPKLNTSVSVPVLALLTRAFKEAGVITNTNLQEIFRFVSANYTSQQRETISPGNFHGKYYNVEENTKRKVSDLLLELVKVVKRMP